MKARRKVQFNFDILHEVKTMKYEEAVKQFESMKPFMVKDVNGRKIALYSKSQIDILLCDIYDKPIN